MNFEADFCFAVERGGAFCSNEFDGDASRLLVEISGSLVDVALAATRLGSLAPFLRERVGVRDRIRKGGERRTRSRSLLSLRAKQSRVFSAEGYWIASLRSQ